MINYEIISESVKHYSKYGFRQIETPWFISSIADDITRPITSTPYIVNGVQRLPGSGEQSFLELMLEGNLPPGCYQTITPCFRNEQIDLLHKNYFLKNELIITDLTIDKPLLRLTGLAKRFFHKYLDATTHIKTDDGWDLTYNGIELGSYGYKEHGNLKWFYGTGVAEPRLSTVMNIYGISQNKNT